MAGHGTMERAKQKTAWKFLSPTLLVLTVVVFIPLLISFALSFSDWKYLEYGSKPVFVGLQNYIDIFNNRNDMDSLYITMRYMALTVALEVILGFVVALLLNKNFKGRGIFRTTTILPFMLAEVVVSLMWRFMFQADNGVLNFLLRKLGMAPKIWIDANNAFSSIVLVEVWQHTPFAILIFMAALSSVSPALVEASKIDGASYCRRLWHVILPEIKPQILVVITFRVMFTLRVFTQPYVLTGGGPADLTRVVGINIFQKAFRYYDLGMANALSWILIMITLVIVILLSLAGRKEDTT